MGGVSLPYAHSLRGRVRGWAGILLHPQAAPCCSVSPGPPLQQLADAQCPPPSPGCHSRYRRQYWNDVKKFLQYAMSKPGVWAVTMSQLLDWMEAPVPAAAVSACQADGGRWRVRAGVEVLQNKALPISVQGQQQQQQQRRLDVCRCTAVMTMCTGAALDVTLFSPPPPHPPLTLPSSRPACVQMPAFMAKYPCGL